MTLAPDWTTCEVGGVVHALHLPCKTVFIVPQEHDCQPSDAALPSAAPLDLDALLDAVISSVCGLNPGDYPDDDPDTIRCSVNDLRSIVQTEVEAALVAAARRGGADTERLDWLEGRAYTIYRDRDIEDGTLCSHATVVDEDAMSRRGHCEKTLRASIDAARAALPPAPQEDDR